MHLTNHGFNHRETQIEIHARKIVGIEIQDHQPISVVVAVFLQKNQWKKNKNNNNNNNLP